MGWHELVWVDMSWCGLVQHENDLSFTDAVYFSCVSQTTVGYGDIAPVTESGR